MAALSVSEMLSDNGGVYILSSQYHTYPLVTHNAYVTNTLFYLYYQDLMSGTDIMNQYFFVLCGAQWWCSKKSSANQCTIQHRTTLYVQQALGDVVSTQLQKDFQSCLFPKV